MIQFETDEIKYNGMYRGKVADNNDPSKYGRVKVVIHGIFDNIATSDLPWCVPAYPPGVGSGSGFGVFTVPAVDSMVWCFFESGDVYQPVYFASAPDAVNGLPSERSTHYPNRFIIKTPSGIVLQVDDTDKIVTVSGATKLYVDGQIESTGDVNSGADVVTDEKFVANGKDGVTGTFKDKSDNTIRVEGGIIYSLA